MQAKFLPYCICIFLTCATARAATVTPAYKLGGSYEADSSSTVKCLEGHAGSTLNNPNCKDMSEGCQNNSECVNRFGDGYVCAKGRDGNAKRGVCKYQECSGYGDTACVEKYSHLRSCVKNEIGVFECRITCNWQKIKERGYAYIGSMNVADRMKFEYNLWKNPSTTSLSGNTGYITNFDTTLSSYWYTCINGYISRCETPNIKSTMDSSKWNNKVTGARYKPCLPCSIASGGTWGVEADEDITHVGNYPYATDLWSMEMGIDVSQSYVETSTNFYARTRAARCGADAMYMYPEMFTRLNASFPLTNRQNSFGVNLGRLGLANTVELGSSDICLTWHRRDQQNYRYVSGNAQHEFCSGADYCLQTTNVQLLVYVPKQSGNIGWNLRSSVTKGARTYVNFSRNPYGTLLCCRFGADDNSDIVNSERYFKGCIAINPAQ